jgi:hypothetical protein
MDSEGYQRLNVAFAALAEQSNDRDMQLRWLALAQESSSLAMDAPLNPKACITEETENARVALLLNSLANA